MLRGRQMDQNPSEMSDEFVIRWEIDEVSKLADAHRFSPFQHFSSMAWRVEACIESEEVPEKVEGPATLEESQKSESAKAADSADSDSGNDEGSDISSDDDLDSETTEDSEGGNAEEKSKTSDVVETPEVKTEAVKKFNLYLRCNEEREDFWSCERSTVFRLIHRSDEEKSIKVETTQSLSKESTSWGPFTVLELSKLLEPSEGFIEDDKILVEVRTTVKKKPAFDFTKPNPLGDNVALKFEDGGVLHVCRVYLMWMSPYFSSLFFGDYKEKTQEEIEVKEVATKDFEELLQAIFPSDRPINADTYLPILELGDRYQIEKATNLCENYLMKTKNLTVGEKLLIAEQFRLRLLKRHCFVTFKTLEEAKAFETAAEFSQLSTSLKAAMFERVLELVK